MSLRQNTSHHGFKSFWPGRQPGWVSLNAALFCLGWVTSLQQVGTQGSNMKNNAQQTNKQPNRMSQENKQQIEEKETTDSSVQPVRALFCLIKNLVAKRLWVRWQHHISISMVICLYSSRSGAHPTPPPLDHSAHCCLAGCHLELLKARRHTHVTEFPVRPAVSRCEQQVSLWLDS